MNAQLFLAQTFANTTPTFTLGDYFNATPVWFKIVALIAIVRVIFKVIPSAKK